MAVDLPTVTPYTINPTWQIDSIVIKPEQYQAEIIKVTVFGRGGQFSMYYYDSNKKLYLAQFAIGASASSFYSSLSALPNIYNYGP